MKLIQYNSYYRDFINRFGFKRLAAYRIASLFISLLMAAIVLLVLLVVDRLKHPSAEKLIMREVAVLASPPPPPPPPKVSAPNIDPVVSLQVEGSGVAMPMLEIAQDPITLSAPDNLKFSMEETPFQSLDINWNALSLDDLDDLPNLLTPVRAIFPKALSRKGITQVMVKMDVLIDESGAVTLIEIIENPYPELNAELHKIARTSRFTPPQKDNQPVRARFIWPLAIKA